MVGEVAWSIIARAKGTYLHAQYHRLARRRGKHKAVVAVAHSVLVIIYHVLRTGCSYADLGADYFAPFDAAPPEPHHLQRPEPLGYTVTLTPTPEAA